MTFEEFKECTRKTEEILSREDPDTWEDDNPFDDVRIRERIFYRLIPKEVRQDEIEHAPYVEFFDMAITFRWLIRQTEQGLSSARIEYSHLEQWGMSEEALAALAVRNTPRLFPFKCTRVLSAIQEWVMLGGPDVPLYVFTNQVGINGAAAIFYDQVLDYFGEKLGEDFYILPSSIHETLLIGISEAMDVQAMYDMVWEANHTVVEKNEFLSNQVFYYDREEKKIKIVPK